VSFKLGDASSALALYPWEAVAADAGVAAEGTGFRGFSLHYLVDAPARVDEMIEQAGRAGGTVVKAPVKTPYGYFGYFADPDGYLWKVATGA
jgi:predicted enzyme related to lactoylglutathione lyase